MCFKRGPQTSGGRRTCSFCGKGEDATRRVIAGPNVFICEACVGICIDILHREGVPVR